MADTGAANERLIWIDLEMTGLDTDNDSIIEIATVVTDAQLNVLAEGPEFAIHHPLETLEAMDEWNRNQHRRSGLWQRVIDSTTTLGPEVVGQPVARFLGQHAGMDLHPVIVAGISDQIEHAAAGAGLGVAGTVDQARDACVHDRHRTHRARLQTDEKLALRQTVVA
jgi:oligoribonuclease (3'-5' exoribonuclease)